MSANDPSGAGRAGEPDAGAVGRDAGDVDTGDDRDGGPPAAAVETVDPASEAYGALGSETRVAILRAMLEGDGERPGVPGRPRTFTELYEATDEETTAGFAYHLRQLRGTYLVEAGGDAGVDSPARTTADGDADDDGVDGRSGGTAAGEEDRGGEGYVLTAVGLAAARDLAAGAYTDRVEADPVPLDDRCPFCAAAGLRATVAAGVFAVDCVACGRDLLALPVPPGTARSREAACLPRAVDVRVRNRIATLSAGVCPTCGGTVEGRTERVDRETEWTRRSGGPDAAGDDAGGDGPVADAGDAGDDAAGDDAGGGGRAVDDGTAESPVRVRASFACTACGDGLRCPVALSTLDHPAVVSFYHDHGVDVRDRPIWNVGAEWRERLASTDPWCVVVATTLGGERLVCYLDRDVEVVETRRYDAAAGS